MAQKQEITAHALCAGLLSDPHPWLSLSGIGKACPILQVRHITTQDPETSLGMVAFFRTR